jgi:small nuclear ribonucleoprotein E
MASTNPRVKKVMTQPAHLIFEYLKNVSIFASLGISFLNCIFSQKDRVQIWLYENISMKMEGVIIVRVIIFSSFGSLIMTSFQGFDEYMNLVLDDAYEINTKTGNRKSVGTNICILLSCSILRSYGIFLGRILFKGDCITLIQKTHPVTTD